MSLIAVFFYSGETPKANTHARSDTHSLRTLGRIPVLSGCCGTSALSKPRHNPSHGSGHSVRSQFTVRLSTVYWPSFHCGLNAPQDRFICISSQGSFITSLYAKKASDLPKMSAVGGVRPTRVLQFTQWVLEEFHK